MEVTREITKSSYMGKDAYMVVDVTTGMMGGNDTLIVDASNLLTMKRSLKQSMASVNVVFTADSAVGMVDAMQKKIPDHDIK